MVQMNDRACHAKECMLFLALFVEPCRHITTEVIKPSFSHTACDVSQLYIRFIVADWHCRLLFQVGLSLMLCQSSKPQQDALHLQTNCVSIMIYTSASAQATMCACRAVLALLQRCARQTPTVSCIITLTVKGGGHSLAMCRPQGIGTLYMAVLVPS